jgi:AraC family transcriptional regulator
MQHLLFREGFYGRLLSRRELGLFKLTETEYAPGEQLPKHSHEQSYFCMTMQGSYKESSEAQMHLCTPLTFAFHPAGEAHFVKFGTSAARTFNIEIQAAWIQRLRECQITMDRPAYCRGGLRAWLALRLYREFKSMDAVSALVMEGLLLEIVAETSRNTNKKPGRKAPPWLKDARDFIRDNFSQSLTLKAIARTVEIHPVHLATSFRQHYSATIGEYVRRLRIDFACCQMLSCDQSITEIAVAAGFSDQSHFSRTFKQFLGMSPSSYRLRFQKRKF